VEAGPGQVERIDRPDSLLAGIAAVKFDPAPLAETGAFVRATLGQNPWASPEIGPALLKFRQCFEVSPSGLGRIVHPKASLLLVLPDEGTQLLRDPAAESGDAGLGVFARDVHRKEHLYHPFIQPGSLKPMILLMFFADQPLKKGLVPRRGLGIFPPELSKISHLASRRRRRV
jgi:hypothetical protein